jgi:hypothetical protein
MMNDLRGVSMVWLSVVGAPSVVISTAGRPLSVGATDALPGPESIQPESPFSKVGFWIMGEAFSLGAGAPARRTLASMASTEANASTSSP